MTASPVFLRGGADPGIIDENVLECRYFLAESGIRQGGLGLFTAVDVAKGEMAQPMVDICIYVADTPDGTAFVTHSWARDVFMGSFEGKNPRGACEGVATLVNSMPEGERTSELIGFKQHTNAGLHRAAHPGAGAVTHYYGITSRAVRNVPAGSELTINYGDWEYQDDIEYVAPTRPVPWLRKHGMCIDNIDIKQASNPQMGRGAFAKRAMRKGTLVAPAPIQTYRSRADFKGRKDDYPEALFVNYCIQPEGMDMMFYPYGPGVNLINHSHENPNVALRWSTSALHHKQWLDLPIDQFLKIDYPGALLMEIYALTDIAEGEELFLDYGVAWENAWKKHVKSWAPPRAKDYVYPADMDLTQPFRTIEEQEKEPYPSNLQTVCFDNNWDRDEDTVMNWKEPRQWPEGLVYCHILSRKKNSKGSHVYEVSLGFDYKPHELDDKRYIDRNVPQNAISFVDKPYKSDMHLKNGFRHPIVMPDHMVPRQWRLVLPSR